MKTAISLPDDLFVLANEFAKTCGMSRSELYAIALREYVDVHNGANLIERINAACAGLDTSLPADIAHSARQTLVAVEW